MQEEAEFCELWPARRRHEPICTRRLRQQVLKVQPLCGQYSIFSWIITFKGSSNLLRGFNHQFWRSLWWWFTQVSNHFGSLEGGHYTAYCNSNVQRRWHKFDDQVFDPSFRVLDKTNNHVNKPIFRMFLQWIQAMWWHLRLTFSSILLSRDRLAFPL